MSPVTAEIVRYLIELGANVNAVDILKDTPLHVAARVMSLGNCFTHFASFGLNSCSYTNIDISSVQYQTY